MDMDRQIIRCKANVAYFTYTFCQIKNETTGDTAPFHLWPAQAEVLDGMRRYRYVCLLKGRQIGMTTLVIAYIIWLALFKRPGSTILCFSKGQKEARELIERIRSMILALPPWLQPKSFTKDSTDELGLSNGSRFVSFPSRSTGGDSYTASCVVVDESDLIPDLNKLLTGAKPTISAGGQLILLSRVDKSQPESAFKQLYRAAVAGTSDFWAKFLPWSAHPGRTRAWYEAERREIIARTGGVDELWENHPETPEQALAARQLDKRLPAAWLQACFDPISCLDLEALSQDVPALGVSGLRVYRLPVPGHQYVIGCDPAEGNPNSDNSVSVVMDWESLEQVAVLSGKFEPAVLTAYSAELAEYFNGASVMVERNNHGHTVIQEFQRSYPRVVLLRGKDTKYGWLTNKQSKTAMFNAVAESAKNHGFVIHDRATFKELADLEASTLAAPSGLYDDMAVGVALCIVAVDTPVRRAELVVLDGAPSPRASSPKLSSRGVRWIEAYGMFVAEVNVEGVVHLLGEFEGEAEAVFAVDAAQELLGQPPSFATVPTLEAGDAEKVMEKVKTALWQKGIL